MNDLESKQLENRRIHFQDAGDWARHYSTVRMTVATFVITTCVAILALKWDSGSGRNASPQEVAATEMAHVDKVASHVLNSIAVLWLIGVGIFQAFTYYTFDRLNSQLKHRAKLLVDNEESGKIPRHPKLDHASWAITAVSFFFACFVWAFAGIAILPVLRIVVYGLCVETLIFPFWLHMRLDGKP